MFLNRLCRSPPDRRLEVGSPGVAPGSYGLTPLPGALRSPNASAWSNPTTVHATWQGLLIIQRLYIRQNAPGACKMSAEPIGAARPTEPTQAVQLGKNQPRLLSDSAPAPGAPALPPSRSWRGPRASRRALGQGTRVEQASRLPFPGETALPVAGETPALLCRSWKAQVAWLTHFSADRFESPPGADSGGSRRHSHQMPPQRIA